MTNDELTEWTVRGGVIFWFCFTCNRIARAATCTTQHEIAAIPPPPLDARMN